VYLALVISSAVLSWIKYDALPDSLRMQVNSIGETTQTMEKSKAILYLLGIQVAVLLMMVFVQYTIKHAKQDISSIDTEGSVKRTVAFRYTVSVIIYLLGLVVGLTFLLSLMFTMEMIKDEKVILVVTLGSTFAVIMPLLIYGVKAGQDGDRLSKERQSDLIEKEDDRFWKLGMIYYNPNDPAIFIGKRVGMGWSLNHARWQSWIIYVGILTFVVISILLGR
jgi:uncharacterized membrane protein